MDNELLDILRMYLQKNLKENKSIDEKNPFNTAAAAAKKRGDKEFEFPKGSGKMHPVTMDDETAKNILKSENENLQEKSKKSKKRKKKQVTHDPNYGAPEGSKRDKLLDKARRAYQRGDVAAAAKIRRNMEKKERGKKGYKNVRRSDTGAYTESFIINELNELVNDMVEAQLLDDMLNELENSLNEKKKKKKSKSSGGLSAAVKKSLDKKADRRCLTRGSVYSEFRKGLAAYLSSGSRKGMSAHQWAHARVNSANPSKSWATVKKRKTCPKKKKK